MKNTRGLIILAVVAVVAIGYFAMRGGKIPPGGMEGTIGAAKKYQSEQIAPDQVKLDAPEIQAFLQSDTFHKIQTDAEFRKMVTDPEFQAALKSGALQRAAADPEAQAVFRSPSLAKISGSPELSSAFKDQDLRRAIAENGSTLGRIVANKAELARLTTPEFARAAQETKFLELAAAGPDLGKLVKDPATLSLMTKAEQAKVVDKAELARLGDAYNRVANSEELKRLSSQGDALGMLASPDFRKIALNGDLAKVIGDPAALKLLSSEAGLGLVSKGTLGLAAAHPELGAIASDKSLQLALAKPELDAAFSNPSVLGLIAKPEFQALANRAEFWAAVSKPELGMIAGRQDFARLVAGTPE